MTEFEREWAGLMARPSSSVVVAMLVIPEGSDRIPDKNTTAGEDS